MVEGTNNDDGRQEDAVIGQIQKRKNQHETVMKNNLVTYVKERFFKYTKFPVEEKVLDAIIEVNLETTFGTDPVPDSLETSAARWGGTINGAITACRHNAQTLARKNYKGKYMQVARQN